MHCPFYIQVFSYWLALLGLLVGVPSLAGQGLPQYYAEHYSTSNGLTNNSVSSITEDSQGHLWVGTQYGLNRFDGQRFQAYTYAADQRFSLTGNWVRSLRLNTAGHLWIGSHGGSFARLDTQADTFLHRPAIEALAQASVLDIIHHPDGSSSLATGRGVYRIRANGQVDQHQTKSIVYALDHWKEDQLLVRDQKSLSTLSWKDSLVTTLVSGRTDAFLQLSRDSLLVFREGNLALLQAVGDQWQAQALDIKTPTHPQAFYSPILFRDRSGRLWVSGEAGIWLFSADLRQRTFLPLRSILPYQTASLPTLQCLYEDRNGIIWLGTNQGLLQLTPTLPFRDHPMLAQGSTLPNIRTMAAQGTSYYLAGLRQVYYWTPRLAQAEVIADAALTALIAHPNGQVFGIGYYNQQLSLMSFSAGQPTGITLVQHSGVRWGRLQIDQKGRIWISTWLGLVCWDPITQDNFYLELPDAQGNALNLEILDILADAQDRLWIGSLSLGLFQIDDLSQLTADSQPPYRHYQHHAEDPASLSTNVMQSLHQDQQGRIWVGTDGGLNLFQENTATFRRWLRNEEMPDDKILDLLSDAQGRLWCSTVSHGLLAFDSTDNSFYSFTQRDGLHSDDMLIGSTFADQGGRLWMGSLAGLHAFFPAAILSQRSPADTLSWESVQYYRADSVWQQAFPQVGTSIDQPLLITAADHSVQLSFAWLNFRYARKQHYQYQLTPLHEQWLPTAADGKITLSQLPTGRYTLRVRAQSNNSSQQAIAPVIYLRVLPPWYRSIWAWAAYFLLGVLLIYYTYHTQLSRRLVAAERAQAEVLIASKLRFFQQVAHEFRSPLTLVYGAVEQLKRRLPASSRQEVGPQLQQLERQAGHLTEQVDEILELAKLQAAGATLELQQADFVQYQQFLFQSFASVAEAQGVSLAFAATPTSLFFAFDADKWRKITGNLMSNALKFTPPGGSISLAIRLVAQDTQNLLHYTLTDTGQGMQADFLAQAFEPFVQEDSSQGTGIGLALTKALVELHGGTIQVDSHPGAGSSFHITLPCTSLAPTPMEAVPAPAESEQALILIAEDHPEVREYLHDCLRGQYQLRLAENGTTAWRICQDTLPDLVISDVMMPGGSGLELSRRIRDNDRTNHIPLILLTGKTAQSARLAGLRAGADAYLTKPFHREELLLRIQGLLDARQRLQEKYQSGDFSIRNQSKATDTFMQQVVEIIKTEIDNEALTVESLASQLHLSRVQLFRKLKALTGKTPTLFIRQIRLLHGRQLLRVSELNISQVAYACGFKDPAYFARVYRENFGLSPSDERQQEKK